ncbi:MAG: C2 family cysteine protease [Lentisphaerota bacterium]
MKKILYILFLSVIISCGYAEDISSPNKSASTAAVLSENWGSWTDNKETISLTELQRKLSDTQITGKNAAALVALAKCLNISKKQSITKNETLKIIDSKFYKIKYDAASEAVEAINRNLFASGKPDFGKLQQGPAGDCYFFSGTGWIAKNRPDVIINAIHKTEDNKYHVRFPDGESVVIEPPSDAELIYVNSVSTLSDGLWMGILQKALGARRESGKAATDDILDINSGTAKSAVHMWTGHNFNRYVLKRSKENVVRRELIFMQEHKLMAEAATDNHSGKLPDDHDYAVLGFDKETDTLTLWNPWGIDVNIKGESGPQNGYEQKKGIFTIKLSDFKRFFFTLVIEKN